MKRLCLVESKTPELLDDIQELYASGKTSWQARNILKLSKAQFKELTVMLRSVSTTAMTPEQTFEEYVDEFTRFEICAKARLAQLDGLLQPMLTPDPIDGHVNSSGSRRLIRAMSKLDGELMQATTMLLQAKIKLGLIDNVPDQPVRQEYLPGTPLSSESLFRSSTVRAAWAQRLLQEAGNGNGHSRN